MAWGTVSLLEVLWTLLSSVGYGAAVGLVVIAQRDLLTLPARIQCGNLWGQPFTATEIRQLWLIARTARRHALERAYMLGVVVVVGIRSMLVPPPPADDSIWSTLVGLLLIGLALDLTAGALRDCWDRIQFDRIEAQDAKEQDDASHSP